MYKKGGRHLESLASRTLAANMTSSHVPHAERVTEKQGTMDTCFFFIFLNFLSYEWDTSLFSYLCWISVVERCVCGTPIVQLIRTMPLTMVVLGKDGKDLNVLTSTTHVISLNRTRGINKRVVVAQAECTDAGVNIWLCTLELARSKDGVAFISRAAPWQMVLMLKLNYPQRVLLSDLVFVSRSAPLCLHPRRMMEVSGGPSPLSQSQRCYHTKITVIRWNVTDSVEADDMFTHAWEIWASSWAQ